MRLAGYLADATFIMHWYEVGSAILETVDALEAGRLGREIRHGIKITYLGGYPRVDTT